MSLDAMIDGAAAESLEAWKAERDADHANKLGFNPDPAPNTNGEEPDGEEPSRRLRLTLASTIRPRPVWWLWRDRIPTGELTLTPGRGGIGKSTFHSHIIARVTTGQLDGVHLGTPRACVIAATEDSWDHTIVPRLIVAGADLDLVFRVDVITDIGTEVSISLPVDLDALATEIVEHRVALLSVDPLLGVVHNTLDTHKDRDVRQALEPLAQLAHNTGCVVLGNAHYTKAGSDPLLSIMGAAAFGNVARAALGFARDTDDESDSCVISQVKNNLGRLDLPSLRYRIEEATLDTDEGPASVGRFVDLGESDRTVADILRDNGSEEDRTERNETAEFIRSYLIDHDGSAPAADVLKAGKAAGFSDSALKHARKRAGARTVKRGGHFGGDSRWEWTIDAAEGALKVLGRENAAPSTPSAPSTTADDPLKVHLKVHAKPLVDAEDAEGAQTPPARSDAPSVNCPICGENSYDRATSTCRADACPGF